MYQQSQTRESEEFLEDLVEELSVPVSRYEQAERSYQSLGDWLCRDGSLVQQFDPVVYVQGSFRLGTTIRPSQHAEEYDIDSVCEFQNLPKTTISQQRLKELLGVEMEAYRRSQNMVKPLREGRRCWVLDYADEAQFHMDVVPALPNAQSTRVLLKEAQLDVQWTTTAIAITDREVPNYSEITQNWPRSNPKGYSEWFKSRMALILLERKVRFAKDFKASVEDIPDYKVRTPLQSAVMILKRHRDYTFADQAEIRPISVIITTLAAHAYNGEETIGQSLATILAGMDKHIEKRNGKYWISNPTDPLENFADKWAEHPERALAFFNWLDTVRDEYAAAARSTSRKDISETIGRGVGKAVADSAANRRQAPSPTTLLRKATAAPVSTGLTFPDHSRVPTKPQGFA